MEEMTKALRLLNNFRVFLLIFSLGIIFQSCQIEPGFEENTSMGTNGWPEKQIVSFKIPEIPENGQYQLFVNIRQNEDYPFYNCYFIPQIKDSKGKILKRTLAEGIFYDPKTGKPKGEGSGNLYNHSYLIFDKLSFKKGEKLTIEINQFMRRDTLQGIFSVGYTLKPINKDGKN